MARFWKHKGSTPISTFAPTNFNVMNKALQQKQQGTDKVKSMVRKLDSESLKGNAIQQFSYSGAMTDDMKRTMQLRNDYTGKKNDIVKSMTESDGSNENEIVEKIFALKGWKDKTEQGELARYSENLRQKTAYDKAIMGNDGLSDTERATRIQKGERAYEDRGQGFGAGNGDFNEYGEYNPSKRVNIVEGFTKFGKAVDVSKQGTHYVDTSGELIRYGTTTTEQRGAQKLLSANINQWKGSTEYQNDIKDKLGDMQDGYIHHYLSKGLSRKEATAKAKEVMAEEWKAADFNSYITEQKDKDGKVVGRYYDPSKVNSNTYVGNAIAGNLQSNVVDNKKTTGNVKNNPYFNYAEGTTYKDSKNAYNEGETGAYDNGYSFEGLSTKVKSNNELLKTLKEELAAVKGTGEDSNIVRSGIEENMKRLQGDNAMMLGAIETEAGNVGLDLEKAAGDIYIATHSSKFTYGNVMPNEGESQEDFKARRTSEIYDMLLLEGVDNTVEHYKAEQNEANFKTNSELNANRTEEEILADRQVAVDESRGWASREDSQYNRIKKIKEDYSPLYNKAVKFSHQSGNKVFTSNKSNSYVREVNDDVTKLYLEGGISTQDAVTGESIGTKDRDKTTKLLFSVGRNGNMQYERSITVNGVRVKQRPVKVKTEGKELVKMTRGFYEMSESSDLSVEERANHRKNADVIAVNRENPRAARAVETNKKGTEFINTFTKDGKTYNVVYRNIGGGKWRNNGGASFKNGTQVMQDIAKWNNYRDKYSKVGK